MRDSRTHIFFWYCDILFFFFAFEENRHFRTRCRFHCHLRLSISIKVITDKLGIMSTGSYIFSHVQAPHQFSIQFITIQIAVTGISFDRDIMGVGRIPFHNILILSIAVYIRHRHIVC